MDRYKYTSFPEVRSMRRDEEKVEATANKQEGENFEAHNPSDDERTIRITTISNRRDPQPQTPAFNPNHQPQPSTPNSKAQHQKPKTQSDFFLTRANAFDLTSVPPAN